MNRERMIELVGVHLSNLDKQGYLTQSDAEYLFNLGEKVPKCGTILEIGAGDGWSMSALGVGSKGKGVKLISIDPFELYQDEYSSGLGPGKVGSREMYEANLRRFGLESKLLLKNSFEAINEFSDCSVDLLFIDGNHQCECVKNDIANYYPKVKLGGIICGHDYQTFHPGVIRAVDQLFGKQNVELGGDSVWKATKEK